MTLSAQRPSDRPSAPNRSFAHKALFTAMAAAAAVLALASGARAAESVEVSHWWTSGGETAAVGKFKEALKGKGYEWEDLAAGGADTFAFTQINNTRVAVRLPPKPLRAVGSTCWVTLDTSAVNLFDPATEQRLTPESISA